MLATRAFETPAVSEVSAQFVSPGSRQGKAGKACL